MIHHLVWEQKQKQKNQCGGNRAATLGPVNTKRVKINK